MKVPTREGRMAYLRKAFLSDWEGAAPERAGRCGWQECQGLPFDGPEPRSWGLTTGLEVVPQRQQRLRLGHSHPTRCRQLVCRADAFLVTYAAVPAARACATSGSGVQGLGCASQADRPETVWCVQNAVAPTTTRRPPYGQAAFSPQWEPPR